MTSVPNPCFPFHQLTLFPINAHFNILKKKALGKLFGKRWNCSKWAISPFPTMFSMQPVSKNPLIATFQLSSAASLSLGWSQNSVLRNGLTLHNIISKAHVAAFPQSYCRNNGQMWERNSVAVIMVNPQKKYWSSRGLNQLSSCIKSCVLSTELCRLCD